MGVLGGNSPGQRDRATGLQGNVLDHATSDTDLSPSQSALGLGRLRLGDEEGGRKGCLQGSWANRKSPHHVLTKSRQEATPPLHTPTSLATWNRLRFGIALGLARVLWQSVKSSTAAPVETPHCILEVLGTARWIARLR